ncbi:pyridoxamine 5'-phosphate oxidase [Desulfobacterota bacterium AH_259_B03_O07]|nr:pyridoxamine 5'-phosphate oxidase [Desulfobacterota bacterium AH_259_B03_O07]
MVDGNETYVEKKYESFELKEEDLDPNPFKQFGKWYEEAHKANSPQPNAMTLATATTEGKPSARMMLLKGFDENGFVFYTNNESVKGRDLSQNPRAAIVFWWSALERQIRIDGSIEEVSEEEAETYFKSRARGSCLGAWVSQQSMVIKNREFLDNRYSELEKVYTDRQIPRPPYWVGYHLIPSTIEFWQGRPDRLHDRLRYRLDASKSWIIERLAP